MPPRFNLQNVLDIRHSRVESLEIELGKLNAALLEARDLLSYLLQNKTDLLEQLHVAQTGDLDLQAIQFIRATILKNDEYIQLAQGEVDRLMLAVEAKRRELVQAKQDEETLQILKRKRIEQYNEEQAQIEARAQDDIYIARAFRGRGAEV